MVSGCNSRLAYSRTASSTTADMLMPFAVASARIKRLASGERVKVVGVFMRRLYHETLYDANMYCAFAKRDFTNYQGEIGVSAIHSWPAKPITFTAIGKASITGKAA